MNIIKSVIEKLYCFDFTKTNLLDGYEVISDEFVDNFACRDVDRGFSCVPFGYTKGFFYKAEERAIYNSPKYLPDLITFGVHISGLKKGHFYRISVTAKNVRKYSMFSDDVTEDRTLTIKNAFREVLISKDFSDDLDYTTVTNIFRAESIEDKLSVTVGKIFLRDVVIEEIEVAADDVEEEVISDCTDVYEAGKKQMVSYGIFAMGLQPNATSRRQELHRVSGKGLLLFFDSVENAYYLERDNENDIIDDNLASSNIIININTNKMVNNGTFTHYDIVNVSTEISPNTLKSGYLVFKLLNGQNPVKYDDSTARIYIDVEKLY